MDRMAAGLRAENSMLYLSPTDEQKLAAVPNAARIFVRNSAECAVLLASADATALDRCRRSFVRYIWKVFWN